MEQLVQASESRILPRSSTSFPVYLLSGELQQIRDLENISQQELGRTMGVKGSRVSYWESNPHRTPRAVVKAIGYRYPDSFIKVIPKDRFRNEIYSRMLEHVRRKTYSTQAQLSERMGINQQDFSCYERGAVEIPTNIRELILDIYNEVIQSHTQPQGITS